MIKIIYENKTDNSYKLQFKVLLYSDSDGKILAMFCDIIFTDTYLGKICYFKIILYINR